MVMRIKKAAVLGSGVMGSQIAAHIANAGIPCLLLDIAPKELTPEEQAKGLSLESPQVRNRIISAGWEFAKKAKPAALFSPEVANLVTLGNFEDDLAKIKDCDWVVEAIVENLDIKRSLYARVEPHLKPEAIVTSNTSGIPLSSLAEGRSENFRRHFLGTHFFNPPRYLHLMEIITQPDTDPEVTKFMAGFTDRVLGKGVVYAKDRPGFVANRIGNFSMLHAFKVMTDLGLTFEEVDALTGTAIGHAKSASFRTIDIVGLDTAYNVARNLYNSLTDDEMRESFKVPEFMEKMVGRKMLGDKTKGGFYKKVGSDILTLDTGTFEYRPQQKAKFASLDAAKQLPSLEDRLKALIYARDKAGEFLWRTTSESLIYAANRIPEIADNIIEIDNAMKWGFAHEMGPFEVWDAIGVEKSVAKLREEGRAVPANVEKMLAAGAKSFYRTENGARHYFDFAAGAYKPEREDPGIIILKSLKEREKVIKKNAGASLIDLGDGVACVEFHAKMNALGGDQIQMVGYAVREVEKNFEGLVVGNQGENFSAGANIMLMLMGAQEGDWDEINLAVRQFQNMTMSLRYSAKPVVVAPFGLTLGGGCEMTLHADRACAAAETYIGLVEVGVGLIPGGGGTKEAAVRASDAVADNPQADHFSFLQRWFENIAMAKVATSAIEARHLGLIRPSDRIVMNKDRQIAEAKQTALALAKEGYVPPQPRTDVLVLGEAALTKFKLGIHMMKRGGYISDHDALIGTKIAEVVCGGRITQPARVSEQYLLDLEREAFISLLATRPTQERLAHMLKTGKPLRN
ncbi:MAG TPA: 3-hydroxyacyl-CoA dehydrogenase NAD-binding domain-containing protein [Blastocatellia bacterium]|nr:3-hydroxyacyl-CoA dehydrogenase NAD-binding domain-containing protein [Blastocatellia bacterium]